MANYTLFNLRGDTRANWLAANPILNNRELAMETDTMRFKVGDGLATYSQLPYGRNTGEYLNFYNVTAFLPLPAGYYYTHDTAISKVVANERCKGLIVSYEVSSGIWYTERFIGTDVANWGVLANWEQMPDSSDFTALHDVITAYNNHAENTSNPHSVTKEQIGLLNVDNTSDLNKPISTATQNALDNKVNVSGDQTILGHKTFYNSPIVPNPTENNDAVNKLTLDLHKNNSTNPHQVTKAQVGLGNADNTSDADKPISSATQTALNLKENTSNKGAINGYASLDETGKVPTGQLPSYVDDVLEYANLASFPVSGVQGKIYVALDTNKTYRWSGSAYIYITSGAVDSVAGKTGVVSLVKGDVGLGNVDNTSDANKPVSTAQQTALNLKADKTKQVIAGNGLTGGGDLSADRTINVGATDDSVVVGADGIKVDTQNLLTSTSVTKPLAANQGKVLDGKIVQLGADLNNLGAKMSVVPFFLPGGNIVKVNDSFTLTKCCFYHGNGRYTITTDGTYALGSGQVAVVSNLDVNIDYDGVVGAIQTPVIKLFNQVTSKDIILITCGFNNDMASIWDILLDKERYTELSIITKPEYLTFSNSSGSWRISTISGAVEIKMQGESFSLEAFDLALRTDTYSILIIDKNNRTLLVKTTNEAYSLLRLSKNYALLGSCLLDYGVYDIHCNFNINGKPNGITETEFSLTNDTPVVTNTLAFKDDESTPIYKNGLFKSLQGGRKTTTVLETILPNGKFKRYEIGNPTYLKSSDLGTSAKIVFETELKDKIYKNITKIYKSLSTGHVSTLKLMTIGDSLSQGNSSVLVSPLAQMMNRLSAYGITVTPCGTFDQNDGRGEASGVYVSEGRGYWNYKTFVGKASSAYSQQIAISTGTGLTAKFENPFLKLADSNDKTNHPDWCFRHTGLADELSYSEDSDKTGDFYIFDFAYYLAQHSVTVPDVITISLGINDWQEAGIMNIDDVYLSMQIMYKQIRAALPNVQIMLVPTNSVLPADQDQWTQEMFPFLERLITYIEGQQAIDSKLHLCPIFQHVDRFNAYSTDISISTINNNNNIFKATMSDVHAPDKESARLEYMDAFESTLLSLIN